MPKHTYDVTIGKDTYAVESDNELTDAQAYQYAKSQVPLDVKAQNATARANMAKQPTEAEMRARAGAEGPFSGDVLHRAAAGASGEVEGLGAGLAAPILALYQGLRHPVDTAETVGQLALAAGAKGVQALAHPIDTYEAAKAAAPGARDAVVRFASDPTNIGRAAGGVMAAIATPPALKFARSTKLGQAALEVGESIPVAGKLVQRLVPSNATLDTNFGTAMAAKDVRDTARAAVQTRGAAATDAAIASQVVPNADAAAATSSTAVPVATRIPYTLPPEFQPLDAGADEAVRAQVVPTADAAAESLYGTELPTMSTRVPYAPVPETGLTPAQTEQLKSEMASRYLNNPGEPTPLATAARSGASREPIPTFEQAGKGGRGNETGATPSGEVAIPAETPPVAKFAFEWPEAGGDKYQLLQDVAGHPAGDTVGAQFLLDNGIPLPPKTGGMSAEQALIGSRGMGHLNLEGRKVLLAEMLKRPSGGTE